LPINESVGWRVCALGNYEVNEITILQQLIKPQDICVDIGANAGLYAVLMAKAACHGRVMAFEPVPLYKHILNLNIALNNLSNVVLHDYALSDSIGEIEMSVSKDGSYSSMKSTGRKEEARKIFIHTHTLDELFVPSNTAANIIKIDVEGAELLVLRGGSRLLASPQLRPRALLVELSEVNQAAYEYAPQDAVDFMKQYGYTVYSPTRKGIRKGWPVDKGSEEALFLLD
jgi:FkbM family methyltransferase